MAATASASLEERFLDRLIVGHDGSHWSLDACKNNKGYHMINVAPHRSKGAHVVSYELFVGPVPEGLEVDHQCDVKWCCNWRHLKPMTHLENMARTRWDVCGEGLHDLNDPANVYLRPDTGVRNCRPCRNRRSKEHRERRKR